MAGTASIASNEESLKLAVALSLLRSKSQQIQKEPSCSSLAPSQSDALRWKRKAKERKQLLLRLREDLKEAQDTSQCDLFPESSACKCYFFDNLGKLSPRRIGDGRFHDVLRRRFLRQVRIKERRRRTDSSTQQRLSLGLTGEDDTEQLRSSVDFLVELCDTVSPVDQEFSFANLAHQAVDFILASLKNLLPTGKNLELIEGIVNGLIIRLTRRMCFPLQADDNSVSEAYHVNTDAQFYAQHLIRKLGSEPYIGQRAILAVSQRISVLAERLLFSDPFDDTFPGMHECMFTMIQLIEFLVSDYLSEWSKTEGFDNILLEDWVTSILHARKALELLESRNGLYVLYMDRVMGELAKQFSLSSSYSALSLIEVWLVKAFPT
ncbi:Protein MULTIPOLAR SPINDLE 1 [Quillaja saponaria]|uniref:Protein MULTIPOLAR SPINDLE 1 n=1 Tax=Quillaja saponaria TaxID=32244 RepID=A0AAD7LD60_QUISA|nr:Protein MULTIPOLAR SPINDLE 1 [Quillaja saponaria]